MGFRKVKILIVEDEVVTGEELKQQLIEIGYDVCDVVYTGEDAIVKAETERPDLIIMDVILPGLVDGIQAAELIKSRYNIPIVYLTAYLDNSVIERAKYSSPYSYLSKPYKLKDLLAIIQAALQKHQETGKLDRIVSNTVEKCVEELKVEVDNIKQDIGFIKKSIDNLGSIINKAIVNQFKEFFGDQKDHIVDHNYVKEHREKSNTLHIFVRNSIVSFLIGVITSLIILGTIQWHDSRLHSEKNIKQTIK
jgi:CheY-like chemotaxis protein